MKKFIYLLSLVALLSVSFTSCTSSDDTANTNKLVQSIVDVAANGDTKTTFFSYNGTKITNIVNADQEVEFTYTNDLITRVVDIDLTTSHQNTLDYTYANDQLVKIVSSDNYIMNFVHHSDNTVSYQKLNVDSNGNEVLVYHGTLIFENDNLIKDERTMDDTPVNVLTKDDVIFEYDAKRNPFHNITGFTKLLNYFDTISPNNAVKVTNTGSVVHLDTEQAVSYITDHAKAYQYDSAGYPTEIVSEQPVFGTGIANHVSSTFHY